MPLALNIKAVRDTIDRLAPGRQITIVAATKTRTADEINALPSHGILDIGENRVQEWQEKKDLLDPALRFHHIGQLQTNKVKYLIDRVHMIQSVDRPSLLHQISRLAAESGRTVDILLQVNTAREDQKGGILPEELDELYGKAMEAPGIRLRGLMCMAPLEGGQDAAKSAFEQAAQLFEGHRSDTFDTLSMGMSQDYPLALSCGATMIRLGSTLFGERDA